MFGFDVGGLGRFAARRAVQDIHLRHLDRPRVERWDIHYAPKELTRETCPTKGNLDEASTLHDVIAALRSGTTFFAPLMACTFSMLPPITVVDGEHAVLRLPYLSVVKVDK